MNNVVDKFCIDIFFGSDSVFFDQMALTLTNAYFWVPLFIALFVLIVKNNDNVTQILLAIGCIALCVFIASGMSNLLVKPLVERIRPCNDPEFKYLAQIAGDMHSKDFSFFSSHAANTIAVATFFTLMARSVLLSTTLYLWAVVNMWTRLYLGQHFFTDVIVGVAWVIVAALISYYLYYKLYKKVSTETSYISSHYTSAGYSYIDVDAVTAVFFLMLCISTLPLAEIYSNLINYIH